MDAKEILRLMVRNRFWIVLGIAAILPIIGYFVTAGSVKEQTEAKAAEIKSAQDGAQAYTTGLVPNGQYGTFTQQKIASIEKDVNAAHRRLYERQAPLLDWPEEIAPEMTAWGRDIPEDISENETQAVAYVYTQVYDKYAEEIYKIVKPWDPVTGEGIVVVPPIESLLETVSFDINNLPSIGKIWQYQENLWVRRSILEVIAEVNRKAGARDWETAAIKQISRLEVGNTAAIDHRTLAEGYQLQDPPEVTKGGQAIEPETPKAAAGGAMGAMGMMGGAAGGEMSMMPGYGAPGEMGEMGGMAGYGEMMGGMMGGMGGVRKGGGPVRFLQPEGVELFRDYPAYLSVLIDQNSIQNLLVEFENSPMTMRVLEANWTRPKTRVQPPVKGQGFMGMAGFGGFGMGMGGGFYGMEMMGGYGGMPGEMGMMPGYGMAGRGGLANQPRSRVRRDLTKDQDKTTAKKDGEPEKVTIFDPYYNIVELQVYVQARFYYPPAPEQPADELSPGGEPADEATTDPTNLGAEPLDVTPAEASDLEAPAPDEPADDSPALDEPDLEAPAPDEPADEPEPQDPASDDPGSLRS